MYPLQGLDPNNVSQGGYSFLDWTGDTWHPGVDLNTPGGPFTDRGVEIVAPTAGIVRFVELWNGITKGFGSHVWLEHLGNVWTHYCHLGGIGVGVGDLLERGWPIGVCGGSGGWIDHLHFEVLRDRPSSMWLWPKGWPQAQVTALYLDPLAWLEEQDRIAELRRTAAVATALDEHGVSSFMTLNDAQTAKLGSNLWGSRVTFNPDAAIAKQYVEDLKAGKYRGIPSAGEQSIGEGVVVQRFKKGSAPVVAIYADGQGAVFAE